MAVSKLRSAALTRASGLLTKARSASVPMYGSGASPSTIVPRLDIRGVLAANVRPIDEIVTTNPFIAGPIYKVAMRMGALPIKVYRIEESGVRRENAQHPAYKLFRKPNPEVTSALMVTHMVIDLLSIGRHGWLKQREDEDGPPVELWPIPGSMLKPEKDDRNIIKHFWVYGAPGKRYPVRKEDVCYFRLLPHPTELEKGLALFGTLGKIAAVGDDAVDASGEMLRNQMLGRHSVTVSGEIGDEAFTRLEGQIQAMMRNRFHVPVLEGGAKLEDHEGAEGEIVVSSLALVRNFIAETISLPKDDDSKSFDQNVIQPIAHPIEQEWERTLMPEWESDPAFPEFAFRDRMRGDPLQRAEWHRAAILSGQETPNEARRAENLPPMAGGDVLLLPLNMIAVTDVIDPSSEEPRKKDSAEGLGGDEGKDTMASTRAAREATVARARSNWATMRERAIQRNAEAAARRLRSTIKKEAKTIKGSLTSSGSSRAATAFPTAAEIRKMVGRSDADVRDVLTQFLRQTGETAAEPAAEAVGHELSEGALERLPKVFASRAKDVSKTFGKHRSDRIVALVKDAVDKGTSARDLATQIGETYDDITVYRVDGLARSEMAWAHEQAALVTWADAGIERIDVVHGGGPCTTGVCERNADNGPYRLGETLDNVGASFEDADAPPFHPGCTCFAAPHVEKD
jgi:HK97 family phage portal protein